ncbi:MAG: pyridoxamine 5'-phosphate oxidase family protein [Desulfocapsaceae bacterium]|nr:pyridoxamine 5'-phosphate oxidase family protein [Desulfocapsaceae bacterium]
MKKIQGICKNVIEATEWVVVASVGENGPHVVGTWGEYLVALGIQDNEIRIPVGGYLETERNLEHNPYLEILCASRKVQGEHGPGKGCRIRGTGRIRTTGDQAAAVRGKFPWARGVLVITVEEVTEML